MNNDTILNDIDSKHSLNPQVTVLCTLLAISFFPSEQFLSQVFDIKRIICTPKLCNKKSRSPCSFKRKQAFIYGHALMKIVCSKD